MLEISDALSFFRLSCGRWTSQRSQHHLLHRRAEAGASFIGVEELLKGDERLAEIAERGALVKVERLRVKRPRPEHEFMIFAENAWRHGHHVAQHCLGFFESL